MGPRPAKRVTRKPKDSDGDGLSDAREEKLGTNKFKKDTDGDGLSDAAELGRKSNPLTWDSDGDGFNDGHEVKIGTSPLKVDTDGDGLTDIAEDMLGTNPKRADSDGDKVPDGIEVGYGTDPKAKDTNVDPIVASMEQWELKQKPKGKDTDGDGLDDEFELKYGLDPRKVDTDDDGLGDRVEVMRGTDPTQKATDSSGDWSDLGDVMRGKKIDDTNAVIPGQYKGSGARADVSDGTDPKGDVAALVGDQDAVGVSALIAPDATALAEAQATAESMGISQPDEAVASADEPQVLDHGIYEPEFTSTTIGSDLPADGGVMSEVADLSDGTSFTTDESIA